MGTNPYQYDPLRVDEDLNKSAEIVARWDDDGRLRLPPEQLSHWVVHVPLLGIVMFVHGILEVVFAVFLAAVTMGIPDAVQRGAQNNGVPPVGFSWATLLLYAAMAVWLLVLGAMQIHAGIRVRRFRGRSWAMFTLASGSLAICGGCLCFPSAALICAYGLTILFHPSATLAFQLSEAGYSPEQILAAFRAAEPR